MSAAASLDLGLVGNGSVAALVDGRARVSWCCIPAFDGDPVLVITHDPEVMAACDRVVEIG